VTSRHYCISSHNAISNKYCNMAHLWTARAFTGAPESQRNRPVPRAEGLWEAQTSVLRMWPPSTSDWN